VLGERGRGRELELCPAVGVGVGQDAELVAAEAIRPSASLDCARERVAEAGEQCVACLVTEGSL
jgi:hypothetical protein